MDKRRRSTKGMDVIPTVSFDIILKDVVPTYFMYGNVLSLTERPVEPCERGLDEVMIILNN